VTQDRSQRIAGGPSDHPVHARVAGGQPEPQPDHALQQFYGNVFRGKLNTDDPGGYGMVDGGGDGIGGGIGASNDGGPGHVTFYVHTDDTAATLRRVEELGGRVLMPSPRSPRARRSRSSPTRRAASSA